MAVQPQQSSIFGLLMSPHHAYDAWPGQAISVAGGGQQFGHAHCQWSSPRFDWWLVMSVCPLTLQFGPRSEANSQRRLHIVSPFFLVWGTCCWVASGFVFWLFGRRVMNSWCGRRANKLKCSGSSSLRVELRECPWCSCGFWPRKEHRHSSQFHLAAQ